MGQMTRWGWALTVPLWAWAGAASAQGAFLDVRGGGNGCQEASSCPMVGENCFLAGGAMGNCVMRGGEASCVPSGAIACCEGASDCGPESICSALTTSTGPGADLQVCLPNAPTFCRDAADRLSLRQLRDCFSRPAGGFGLWPEGDCDGDGVSNGVEQAVAGADPNDRYRMVCSGPLRRGIEVGNGCLELLPCDMTDTSCAMTLAGDVGVCRVTADRRSLRCQPDLPREELFCARVGGEGFDCLTADNGIDPPLEGVGAFTNGEFCVPLDCSAEGFTNACITDPGDTVGDPPVPFSEGDCDSDGIENEDEVASELCIFNEGDVDAGPDAGTVAAADAGPDSGPPSADAGPDAGVGVDAGRGADGGALDAGPGTPNFSGGGGCACRATPAPTEAPLGIWMLASVALGLRSRRRR